MTTKNFLIKILCFSWYIKENGENGKKDLFLKPVQNMYAQFTYIYNKNIKIYG